MSRPWCIESEAALYNLLSRKKYRSDIFVVEKYRHTIYYKPSQR